MSFNESFETLRNIVGMRFKYRPRDYLTGSIKVLHEATLYTYLFLHLLGRALNSLEG